VKQVVGLMLSFCLCAAVEGSPVLAEEMSNYELTQSIKQLEEKVDAGRIAEGWANRLCFSGVLEAEAAWESMDYADRAPADAAAGDVALATMALGVDAAINDHVSARFLLLWEEDDTEPVDLDEGFLTIGGGSGFPAFLAAGRMVVPFGNFASNMVSDPLTLEFGETRESAIQVGVGAGGFYGSAYWFNGDIDAYDADSHLDNFGAHAGVAMEKADFSFNIGGSYINSLLDSDGWSDALEEAMASSEAGLDEYVAGVGAHAVVCAGPLMFIAEYVSALDAPEFVPDNGGVGFKGEEISAWNAELGFIFGLAGRAANAGIACQGADGAGGFLPETRLMGTVGVEIFKATNLALEYFHDEYENKDEADGVTVQLAVCF